MDGKAEVPGHSQAEEGGRARGSLADRLAARWRNDEGVFRRDGDARSPAVRAGPAGPVSLLDISEAHHKAVRAAQRMVELRGGPPSEHEVALDAFVDADRVFHETLYAYRSPLRRMPISAFLPEGEEPAHGGI